MKGIYIHTKREIRCVFNFGNLKIILEKNYFEKKNKLKLNIQSELHYLRYNFSHKGTQYLEDIIYIVYTKYSNVIVNMNKDIYPIIAKKYNKNRKR